MNVIHSVARIKIRYFDYHLRDVNHHGDCEIYSNKKRCDCGLLHDLRILDYALAEIIYKKFEEDLYKHDTGKDEPILTQEEQDKNKVLLESIFGVVEPPSLTDIKNDYDLYKKVISEGFGKDAYPDASVRLDKWFKKEMNSVL